MLEGTVAAAFPLERLTTAPEGPAFPERVTVPVDGVPPRTLVGLTAKEDKVAGVIVSVAV